MGKRVTVTNETDTGRNTRFRDNRTGETLSRPELVSRIENGRYPNYHVREVNGVKTSVSNSDGSASNNLG